MTIKGNTLIMFSPSFAEFVLYSKFGEVMWVGK